MIEEDSEDGFSEEEEEEEGGIGEENEEEEEEEEEVFQNKPMTKRQRAKLNREEPEDYLQLPMGNSNIMCKKKDTYTIK